MVATTPQSHNATTPVQFKTKLKSIQVDIKNIQNIYQERFHRFSEVADQLQQRYNRLSIVRLLSFFVGIFLAIFLFNQFPVWVGLAFLIFFLAGFVKFVFWHRDLLRQSTHHKYLARINQQELEILAHQYTHNKAGEQFVDIHHPYSLDLDIFGEHSLFQYLNRTSTSIGEEALANYLSHTVSLQEILDRQESIQELKDQLEWRQHFQAFGQETKDDLNHLRLLKLWLADAPFVSGNTWLKIALFVVPIWMAVGLGLSLYWLSWKTFLLFVLLPGIIMSRTNDKIEEAHLRTSKAGTMLASYGLLIKHIEPFTFQSKKLVHLQSSFKQKEVFASKAVQQLSYIISQLDVRHNMFAIFFNLFGLWDLQWVYRLEKWKATYKDHIEKWFTALQEMEALNSFATTYYNNPDWTFPTIQEQTQLKGVSLGHPLINISTRVCNDFFTPTQAHIKLVTGSNMAGKSTFLRTVGINIILAMAGAPVCAERLSLPILQMYTSMRTQDALHESTSSFYAELKRLKVIIQAVESSPNIYFLMDEILKGTNSKDRHTGSRALIEQMIASKGAGIIATHDLELGNMEAASNGAIENLCMEVAVTNGELQFDYKLEKGVSKSFNATILMKEMGIAIKN